MSSVIVTSMFRRQPNKSFHFHSRFHSFITTTTTMIRISELHYADAVVEAFGKQFIVHRAILSSNIPFFKTLFETSIGNKEAKKVVTSDQGETLTVYSLPKMAEHSNYINGDILEEVLRSTYNTKRSEAPDPDIALHSLVRFSQERYTGFYELCHFFAWDDGMKYASDILLSHAEEAKDIHPAIDLYLFLQRIGDYRRATDALLGCISIHTPTCIQCIIHIVMTEEEYRNIHGWMMINHLLYLGCIPHVCGKHKEVYRLDKNIPGFLQVQYTDQSMCKYKNHFTDGWNKYKIDFLDKAGERVAHLKSYQLYIEDIGDVHNGSDCFPHNGIQVASSVSDDYGYFMKIKTTITHGLIDKDAKETISLRFTQTCNMDDENAFFDSDGSHSFIEIALFASQSDDKNKRATIRIDPTTFRTEMGPGGDIFFFEKSFETTYDKGRTTHPATKQIKKSLSMGFDPRSTLGTDGSVVIVVRAFFVSDNSKYECSKWVEQFKRSTLIDKWDHFDLVHPTHDDNNNNKNKRLRK